jgi:hypothetical protein
MNVGIFMPTALDLQAEFRQMKSYSLLKQSTIKVNEMTENKVACVGL